MVLGIIGAMDEEVARLKELLAGAAVEQAAGMDFYRGTLAGKEVVVVRCGIGKVNAAVCTQILADRYHVDGVINTGIAGSLKPEIKILDLVLSTDVVHHDMDAQGFGYPPGQIPRMDTFSFEADEKLQDLALKCSNELFPQTGVHLGRILSGDQFISDQQKKEFLVKTFDGSCTEMEGAAIAQTASLNGIPFLIIRAISDQADGSASMDYQAFEEQAINRSVELMKAMVKRL